MKLGRSIRWYNEYKHEVQFSRENGFDFMQIWYRQGTLLLDKVKEPKEKYIKDAQFPVIIHALFDIDEYEKYLPKLIEILVYLGHTEVIIHPICESERINEKTIDKLCEKISYASMELSEHGIKLYVENNSKLDPIHYKAAEVKKMFSENAEVEFLLDVAHIDDYEHLKELIKIKYPGILHVADKHFNVIHEHLPLGRGEIDYKMVFTSVLNNYDGKVILEVVDSDEELIQSKRIIETMLMY